MSSSTYDMSGQWQLPVTCVDSQHDLVAVSKRTEQLPVLDWKFTPWAVDLPHTENPRKHKFKVTFENDGCRTHVL